MHRIETSTHQIAYRFVPGVRDPYCGQFARPMQAGETGCIPSIRLDPVARTYWEQRRRIHGRASTRGAECHSRTAPPRAEPKPRAAVGELAHQPIQGCRGIGDTTVFPNFAADAVLGYRYDDAFLVNIK